MSGSRTESSDEKECSFLENRMEKSMARGVSTALALLIMMFEETWLQDFHHID